MFSLNWNRYENKSTPFRVEQPGTQTENQMIPGNGWQSWVSTYGLSRHMFIMFADHWRNVIRARTPLPTVPPAPLICVPRNMAESFEKRPPPALHPWLSRSHLGSRSLSLKMVTFLPVLPEAVNFWVVQCHSSCGVWFQAAAVIRPRMPCFRRGPLFYCLVCVKEGPCSKRQRRCSGLLLFSLFLLLF